MFAQGGCDLFFLLGSLRRQFQVGGLLRNIIVVTNTVQVECQIVVGLVLRGGYCTVRRCISLYRDESASGKVSWEVGLNRDSKKVVECINTYILQDVDIPFIWSSERESISCSNTFYHITTS